MDATTAMFVWMVLERVAYDHMDSELQDEYSEQITARFPFEDGTVEITVWDCTALDFSTLTVALLMNGYRCKILELGAGSDPCQVVDALLPKRPSLAPLQGPVDFYEALENDALPLQQWF